MAEVPVQEDSTIIDNTPIYFEKQLCNHKQVTQDIFRVKQGDSQKEKVTNLFGDAPSDCKMDEVHGEEDSPILETTPLSKSSYKNE